MKISCLKERYEGGETERKTNGVEVWLEGSMMEELKKSWRAEQGDTRATVFER